MNELLHTIEERDIHSLSQANKTSALSALESGKVAYFPVYTFPLHPLEHSQLLTANLLDGKHKNISFDYQTQRLGGLRLKNNLAILPGTLKSFMQRYALFARELIDTVFPQYQKALEWGRTSYRPAEIKGRSSSKRKDDTRLHIDSFPATPVNGRRILRVFCNINPQAEPRVWHLGEPFFQAMTRFSTTIPAYNRLIAKFLHLIGATKTLRSAYDHYQLNLHDQMKLSDDYQQTVAKLRFDFAAQSTWVVFTDQVSHAALAGQFLLEQTFYLPIEAMANPALSPLKQWEKEKAILVNPCESYPRNN